MIDHGESRNPVEILAEEFTERRRRGERPTVAEYAEAHPELADEIRQLFPAIVAMERVKQHAASSGDRPFELRVDQLQQLGDYRILREIGRGGMGIVYEAEQQSLGRRVAVKVFPRQSLKDSKHLQRFRKHLHHLACTLLSTQCVYSDLRTSTLEEGVRDVYSTCDLSREIFHEK